MVAVDVVLLLSLLGLVIFPLAARAAAAGLPIAPEQQAAELPPLDRSPSGQLRLAPVFSGGVEPETLQFDDLNTVAAALFDAAEPVLGFEVTDSLISLLRSQDFLSSEVVGGQQVDLAE